MERAPSQNYDLPETQGAERLRQGHKKGHPEGWPLARSRLRLKSSRRRVGAGVRARNAHGMRVRATALAIQIVVIARAIDGGQEVSITIDINVVRTQPAQAHVLDAFLLVATGGETQRWRFWRSGVRGREARLAGTRIGAHPIKILGQFLQSIAVTV